MDNLLTAISRIDEKYYHRHERDFAYEFYHQLRILKWPKNVEVTCETPKKRFSYRDPILMDTLVRQCFFNDEVNENRTIHRYPDILIHEYENRNQQLVAVEIKKQYSADSITRDLAKLAVYCKGRLKYKRGILIVINPNRNFNRILERPEVKTLLQDFPEIQIWIARPGIQLEIICKNQ